VEIPNLGERKEYYSPNVELLYNWESKWSIKKKKLSSY